MSIIKLTLFYLIRKFSQHTYKAMKIILTTHKAVLHTQKKFLALRKFLLKIASAFSCPNTFKTYCNAFSGLLSNGKHFLNIVDSSRQTNNFFKVIQVLPLVLILLNKSQMCSLGLMSRF